MFCDYQVNIIKNENQEEAERWTVNNFNDANLKGATHIEGNDDHLTIGTWSGGIYLWDVKTMKLVESSIGKIKAQVLMLTMKYPYVFAVGGAKGLKVYHLESGKRIGDYQYNDEVFFNVHTNGRFLIISDISGDNRNVFITLDIQELINEKICNKGLWMMEQKMTPVHSLIHVGSSKTKILVANEGN